MKKLISGLFLLALLISTNAYSAGLGDFFSGFSVTSSGESSFTACTGAFVDHKTGGDYAGTGGCTPHWKELKMNGNAIAQLGSIGLFETINVTPGTNDTAAKDGAVMLNIIHMIGLDAGVGTSFGGHFMSTLNFSNQSVIDQFTK